MSQINKPLIKETIVKYLKKFGYPDLTNEQIMKVMPGIFRELDRNDLIPSQMDYRTFLQIAFVKYQEAELRRQTC